MNRYEIYMTMEDVLPGRDDELTVDILHDAVSLIAEQLEDRGHAYCTTECNDSSIHIYVDTKKLISNVSIDASTIIRGMGLKLPFGTRPVGA